MQCGPERWLVDTGSAFDLIGRSDVPDWCARLATPTEGMVELSTGPFKQHVSPLLLESSPPVLSVGKRCMEEGYSFHWPSGRESYLISPDCVKHVLGVDNMVPYLPDPPISGVSSPAPAFPVGVAPSAVEEPVEADEPPGNGGAAPGQ